jgi:hypothetical protein
VVDDEKSSHVPECGVGVGSIGNLHTSNYIESILLEQMPSPWRRGEAAQAGPGELWAGHVVYAVSNPGLTETCQTRPNRTGAYTRFAHQVR